LAPAGTTIVVPLDHVLDEFGNQIITVQAYENDARSAFGIFDTGASALTFSAGDQARFVAKGVPIPIKIARGATAAGLSGTVVGHVSMPGTILADGLHAAGLSFDAVGHAQFTIQFDSGSAATPGIQAFIGTADGSPMLPTITGMPILDGGFAALVNMQGASLDFSQEIPDLVLSLPDLSFVPPGTPLPVGPDSRGPVRVSLTLVGLDSYLSPGNSITEARVPFQNEVSLLNLPYGSVRHQNFLFDTGAQVTVISTRDAMALGVDLQHPEFSTLLEGVGGSQRVAGYTIPELDLPTSDGGSIQFKTVPVFVADLGPELDGILGMNLFNTATGMLYDPFGPGGASVSFTFSKLARAGDDGTPDIVAKLDRLGVSFAGAIHGSEVPGLAFASAKISGQVFLDFNGNGVLDKGEPGLAGQTVYLDLNNSGQWNASDPTATTDENGFYQFTGLASGTYIVRELVSANFVVPGQVGAFTRVVMPQGSTVDSVNFANLAMQPDATTAFVTQLYGDVLDRAPDAAGLSNWVRKLNQGVSRYQVSQAIWESAEHRALQVDGFYQTFLHRDADPSGRQGWMNALLSGASLDQVQQGFTMSAEYQANHLGDASFVAGLYQDVLGRPPDLAGSLVWQGALQSGMGRAQVARAFLTSDEARLRGLDRYYADFLHRQPDVAGEQSWLALLHNGRISPERAAESFIASDEFFAWAKQLSNS
jgi:hypothetical protein